MGLDAWVPGLFFVGLFGFVLIFKNCSKPYRVTVLVSVSSSAGYDNWARRFSYITMILLGGYMNKFRYSLLSLGSSIPYDMTGKRKRY